MLAAVSCFVVTRANVAHIDTNSWSKLFAGELVCGAADDKKVASSCLQPLDSTSTDAPSTSARRLYLAYDAGGVGTVWDLLPFSKGDGSSTSTCIRRDHLAANLLGHADNPDAGMIFLIDSTTAQNVECGGARYCACSNVPACADWSSQVNSWKGDPGSLGYGYPSKVRVFKVEDVRVGFYPAGLAFAWLGLHRYVNLVRQHVNLVRYPASLCVQGQMPRSKWTRLSFRVCLVATITYSSRPETLKWPRMASDGAPKLEGHST